VCAAGNAGGDSVVTPATTVETTCTSGAGGCTHAVSGLPGYDISWTVGDGEIELTLKAPTTGWVGFGLSEVGGMAGADEFVASVDDATGAVTSGDYYSVVEGWPEVDDCDDWTVVRGSQDASPPLTTIVVRRRLNTSDPQDWPIVASTRASRIIVSYGATDTFGYHGTRRATDKINFFTNAESPHSLLTALDSDNDITKFDVLTENYEVPSERKTTYHEICKDLDLPAMGDQHGIAIRHIIDDSGNNPDKGYVVHHFIVRLLRRPCGTSVDGEGDQVYAWAPGVEEFVLPSNVGLPLGGTDGYVAVRVETHYDNPRFVSGERDNSGVRIYWTPTLRQYNMGVMAIGDPIVRAGGQQIPRGTASYTFSCPNTNCFAGNNGGEPVVVFGAAHHMHATGTTMQTRLYDEDGLYHTLDTQFYDFNWQDYIDADPFLWRPDTYAEVECTFNSNGERFGQGSEDEMCMTFLNYYPAYPSDTRYCGYAPLTEFGGSCSSDDYEMSVISRRGRNTGSLLKPWQTFSERASADCPATATTATTTVAGTTTTVAGTTTTVAGGNDVGDARSGTDRVGSSIISVAFGMLATVVFL